MNLLIAGSRGIKEFDLEPYIPENTDLIICGGADGIDGLAEELADKKRISKLIVYPNYKRYGRYAPLKRNEQMIALAEEILVIWDGKSRGSAYTIKVAKESNKKLTVVEV